MRGFTVGCGVLVAVALVSACQEERSAPAQYTPPDMRMAPDDLSKRLEVGMTEAQVTALREPDRVAMSTCGGNHGRPWPCKTYHYGLSLMIIFQEVPDRGWLVNGWS